LTRFMSSWIVLIRNRKNSWASCCSTPTNKTFSEVAKKKEEEEGGPRHLESTLPIAKRKLVGATPLALGEESKGADHNCVVNAPKDSAT
jgi:hypothetical protein